MQGRTAIGSGSGTGLTARTLGTTGGSELTDVTGVTVTTNLAGVPFTSSGSSLSMKASNAAAATGTSGNMSPYTVTNYIIKY